MQNFRTGAAGTEEPGTSDCSARIREPTTAESLTPAKTAFLKARRSFQAPLLCPWASGAFELSAASTTQQRSMAFDYQQQGNSLE